MRLNHLKIELKHWEHEFIDKHGRGPNKEDIKRLPEVKSMYREYAQLRKQKYPTSVSKSPSKHHKSPHKSVIEPHKASLTELGPTPQIYGKTMSIFEMNLSPIKTPCIINENEDAEIDRSTTSTVSDQDEEYQSNVEPLEIKRELVFNSATPNSSPFKGKELGRSTCYGPNSPLRLEEENLSISIRHASPLKRTPTKSLMSIAESSFSPSPLVKRPLTRSLLELVKEHEAIVEEFKNMEENDDIFVTSQEPDNIFTQDDDQVSSDQKIAKTRRRKILRRKAASEETQIVAKDISEEVKKLKQQRVNEFLGIEVNSKEETSKPTDENGFVAPTASTETRKVTRKKNKKYNLVSNNFRRLKLPRKNSSNRRWGNRR